MVGDGDGDAGGLGRSDRQAVRAALADVGLGVLPGAGDLVPACLATRPWADRQDRYARRALPGRSDRQAARAALADVELGVRPGAGELAFACLATRP